MNYSSHLNTRVLTPNGQGLCVAILRFSDKDIRYRVYFGGETADSIQEFPFNQVSPMGEHHCPACKGEDWDCELCRGWGIVEPSVARLT